jgi:hypothetical protein
LGATAAGVPATAGAGSAIVASAAKCMLYFYSEEQMIRFRKFMTMLAVLAGMAGSAPLARADFAIEYRINGGTFTVVQDNGAGDLNPISGAIQVKIGDLTVSAQSTASTSTSLSSIDLSVTGTEAKNTTITILASFTGTETAPPPQTLGWAMSNTTTAKVAPTLLGQEWISNSNVLFNTTSGVILNTGAQTLAPEVLLSGSLTGKLTVPYEMTVENQVTNSSKTASTGNIGTDVNGSITPSATPAPAAFLLLLSGSPALGLAWFRRRKAKAQDQRNIS